MSYFYFPDTNMMLKLTFIPLNPKFSPRSLILFALLDIILRFGYLIFTVTFEAQLRVSNIIDPVLNY